MTEPVTLSPSEVHELWRIDGIELTGEQKEMLPELKKWLEKQSDNHAACLLLGKQVTEMPKVPMKVLSALILEKFRPMKKGIAALQVLGKLMDRGNAMGLALPCPPPVPFLLKQPSSPFAAERWKKLGIADQLRNILAEEICRECPSGSASDTGTLLGLLILSAILHGGLLHATLLEALLKLLKNSATPLSCQNDRVYAELSLTWKKQQDAEFRRWFPDPLSALLIMQLSPERLSAYFAQAPVPQNHSIKGIIQKTLRTIVGKSALSSKGFPRNLSQLIEAARLDLDTRLPPVLVHYAARGFVCHSLKPTVWERIHGVAPEPLEQQVLKPTGLRNPGSAISNEVDDVSEVEPRWMTSLRAAMKGNDHAVITANLDDLLTQPAIGFMPGEAGELFAAFTRDLLLSGGRKTMAISTIKAYAIAAAKSLGGMLGDADITEFGPAEWTSLYEEAFADVDQPGQRRKLVRVLQEFQRFLERKGMTSLDAREVFGVNDGLVPVDANIITPEEFLSIRGRLPTLFANEHPKLINVANLVLTIAYRCGLRRMEVLKLEMADLQVKGDAELLVRPTESRRLKTKSATRRIPLHVLLEEEELKQLNKWYSQRLAKKGQSRYDKFLFAIPELKFAFVPQESLFPKLHHAMRESTGDATLRFHHLRHSFASWTFLKLMQADLTSSIDLSAKIAQTGAPPPHSSGTPTALQRAQEFRDGLYGKPWMTRKHLWAVASLLGHSGPDVSLEHYIHLADVVLAEHLMHKDIAPGKNTLIAASGKSPAQAYRIWGNGNPSGFVAHLWKKRYLHPNRPQPRSMSSATPVTNARPVNNAKEIPFNHIWTALHLHHVQELSPEQIEDRIGIDRASIERYVKNAKLLCDLKLTPGQYRHRFVDFIRDKRYPYKTTRVPCPNRPREKRDLEILSIYAEKFLPALEANRRLTKSALRYYALYSRPDCSGIIFTDPGSPKAALGFLKWFNLLGIPRTNIHFIGYYPTAPHEAPLGPWTEILGISNDDHIGKRAPSNGRRWKCPWVAIEPRFPLKSGEMKSSTAFRYLMVMGYIEAMSDHTS